MKESTLGRLKETPPESKVPVPEMDDFLIIAGHRGPPEISYPPRLDRQALLLNTPTCVD